MIVHIDEDGRIAWPHGAPTPEVAAEVERAVARVLAGDFDLVEDFED